jgi:selenocysteine-specific elongation factor
MTAKQPDQGGLPRLWVDRSFSIKGFGSVVTGTLLGGSLTTGQEVMVYPKGEVSKIRRIQVHDQTVESAVAGQRVAINLPAFAKDQISRGDLIAPPGRLTTRNRIGVWVKAARECPRSIHRGMEVRMHLGSRKIPCTVEYMEPEAILAGQEAWMILRLGEQVPLIPFDRFVIRNMSPVETLAGGQVLAMDPPRGRKARRGIGDLFHRIYQGGLKEAVLIHLNQPLDELSSLESLSRLFGRPDQEMNDWINDLAEEGLVTPYGGFILSAVEKDRIFQRFSKSLQDFHQANPLRRGLPKKQGLASLLPQGNAKQQAEILAEWEAQGYGESDQAYIWAQGFSRRMTKGQEALYQILMDRAASLREAAKESVWLEGLKDAGEIWNLMIEDGVFWRLEGDLYASKEFVESGMRIILEGLDRDGFTVADFRDAYGVSRKQALLLLEAYDREKWTRREGDRRIVRELPKFIG